MTGLIAISNTGDAPLTYTVSITGFESITPTVTGNMTRTITGGVGEVLSFQVVASNLVSGTYSGQVVVQMAHAAEGYPKIYDFRLVVADNLYPVYLPLITKGS